MQISSPTVPDLMCTMHIIFVFWYTTTIFFLIYYSDFVVIYYSDFVLIYYSDFVLILSSTSPGSPVLSGGRDKPVVRPHCSADDDGRWRKRELLRFEGDGRATDRVRKGAAGCIRPTAYVLTDGVSSVSTSGSTSFRLVDIIFWFFIKFAWLVETRRYLNRVGAKQQISANILAI